MPDEGSCAESAAPVVRDTQLRVAATTNGVEFNPPHGKRIALLRELGFTIDALHEIQAPEGATSRYTVWADPAWARHWPTEQLFHCRKA